MVKPNIQNQSPEKCAQQSVLRNRLNTSAIERVIRRTLQSKVN